MRKRVRCCNGGWRFVKAALMLLLFVLPAACSTTGDTNQVTAKAERKVLLIGLDGVRPDVIEFGDTPTLDHLMQDGAFSLTAQTQLAGPTSSAPGWMSILTGVDSDKHLVVGNDLFGIHDKQYPSILSRLASIGVKSAVSVSWTQLWSEFLEKEGAAEVGYGALGVDALIMEDLDSLLLEPFDFFFVHLDAPDHAGHDTGYGTGFPEYVQAIEEKDKDIATMLATLRNRSTYDQEEWLIVVTTDHGGDGVKGHGAQNQANRRIFLIVSGAAAKQGEILPAPTQMDIAPTIFRYMGLDIQDSWGLDGRAVGLR